MSGNSGKIEWYLARDGQQHGPLSAVELDKFIELGHLKPTDLLWRVGFDDWRTATEVFPPLPPKPQPAPPVQELSVGTPAASHIAQPAPSETHSPARPAETTQPARKSIAAGAIAHGAQRTAQPTDYRAPHSVGPQDLGHIPAAQRATPGPTDPSQLIEPAKQSPTIAAPDATTLRPGAAGEPFSAPSTEITRPAAAGLDDDEEYLEDDEGGRSGWLMVAAALFLFVLLGAGGLFAYNNQSQIAALYADLVGRAMPSEVAVVRAPKEATREPAAKPVVGPAAPKPLRPIEAKPPVATVATDRSLPELPILKSKLWQFAQKEFGEWTDQRLAELAEQDKSKEEANKFLIAAFVKFRRNNAEYAMVASSDSLENIASAFVSSLRALTAKGAKACYAYISNGETTPEIAPYYFEPTIAPKLEAQMLAIMQAIADGKTSPTKTRAQPTNADFNKLSVELGKRGWSAADLKLFSDPIALSKAEPKVVCRLVTEWFATQTKLQDEAVRDQLIAASLRPVIGG